MKTIIRFLLALFVLSMMPTTYASAQGKIESPLERKARLEREAAARKKREQEAAARKRREQEAREQAAREQAAREEAARQQAAREEAERQQREQAAREQAAREEAARKETTLRRVLAELEQSMVQVDGGTFTMGPTTDNEDEYYGWEEPAHKVTLSAFSISRYEVTQELWEAVMGSNPSHFKGPRRPVEYVSWEDCQTFIVKLNSLTGKKYRLPTEAEWEYAARGGKNSKGFKYAGSDDLYSVGWFRDNCDNQTHNIAQKRPNELGLFDMSGNVFEWVEDYFAPYESGKQTNPRGPVYGEDHVYRGGSWEYPFKTGYCRVWTRRSAGPTPYHSNGLGFRLAQ
ncbi:MAG: SUMF1/EgtB/PvdO family nonheme iron enzyme [Prevotella sp.]|nr:SUMF1/EgtB/PvdO family nonheme iron enzyme [Prevotella sp.]